jgi:hypothetical protein
VALGRPGQASAQAEPGQPAGPSLQQPPQPAAERAAVEAPPPPAGDRGPLGLLLHLGPYTGFGAGLALGTKDVGLRASAGWAPLLLAIDRGGSNVDLSFHSSLQISPDLYLRLLTPRPTTLLGLTGGYRYNTLLGHGFGFGAYAQFGLGRVVDGLIWAGFLVHPVGEDHLKREKNLPGGTKFAFPGPNVSFGASLGLATFP